MERQKNRHRNKNSAYKYRRRRRYKKRFFILMFILLIIAIASTLHIIDKMNIVDNLAKNTLEPLFKPISKVSGYDAKSLILMDMKDDNIIASKNSEDEILPASLAKLFVIEFADEHVKLDEVIKVDDDFSKLIKEGSSVANIEKKEYTAENLFAAMLVPSGNDAAYALADYVGGKLDKKAKTTEDRIDAFVEGLNDYLKEKKYSDTVLHDPSGYDKKAVTSVSDLKKVSKKLLKKKWFRNIVSQGKYTAILPDKSEESWKNTNEFLNKKSKYYNKNVTGIKTGSLNEEYNIVVLYKSNDREFLICSLGSKTRNTRYEDVKHIIEVADELSALENAKLDKK
ncbi:MAG: serine hydrolase [Eubacteriales bacterium]|nr:serine hydrolase [Eubacteriales bacterium]MDY3332682.1 serine hydrolase [Gallibacter sp.]